MDAWPALRKRETNRGREGQGGNYLFILCAWIDAHRKYTHTDTMTWMFYIDDILQNLTGARGIMYRFILFCLSDCVFFFFTTTGNLPCSSLLHSICPCVSLRRLRVSSSPGLSPYFILPPSRLLRLSPWGHWGQAWCRGLVESIMSGYFMCFQAGSKSIC